MHCRVAQGLLRKSHGEQNGHSLTFVNAAALAKSCYYLSTQIVCTHLLGSPQMAAHNVTMRRGRWQHMEQRQAPTGRRVCKGLPLRAASFAS